MECPPGYHPECVPDSTTPPPNGGTPPVVELYEVYAIPWAHDLGGSGVIGYQPIILDTRTMEQRPATLDELKIAAEKTLLAIAIIEGAGTTPPTEAQVQKVCR